MPYNQRYNSQETEVIQKPMKKNFTNGKMIYVRIR